MLIIFILNLHYFLDSDFFFKINSTFSVLFSGSGCENIYEIIILAENVSVFMSFYWFNKDKNNRLYFG